MKYVLMNKFIIRVRGLISLLREGWSSSSRLSIYQQAMLFALIMLFTLGSSIVTSIEVHASRADPGLGKVCTFYTVISENTLSGISLSYHTSIWSLAQTNHISNINRIFVGQRLCIPTLASGHTAKSAVSGQQAKSGTSHSLSQQVPSLLKQAATRHGLPANLLLAIAWQESGWNQQVVAHDGGIGIMQIMPSTAKGLNTQTKGHYDPYKLQDNIELGAIYLHSLWQGFQGNEAKVISAYNQGGSSVTTHGIANWPYVHNVQALMKQYR